MPNDRYPILTEFVARKVLVTGSVNWAKGSLVRIALNSLAKTLTKTQGQLHILTGMASGADAAARAWAHLNDTSFFAEPLEAGVYPKPMQDYNYKILAMEPDIVLAFKDEFDPNWQMASCVNGTEHMCRIAAQANIPVLLNLVTMLNTDISEKVI